MPFVPHPAIVNCLDSVRWIPMTQRPNASAHGSQTSDHAPLRTDQGRDAERLKTCIEFNRRTAGGASPVGLPVQWNLRRAGMPAPTAALFRTSPGRRASSLQSRPLARPIDPRPGRRGAAVAAAGALQLFRSGKVQSTPGPRSLALPSSGRKAFGRSGENRRPASARNQ